MTTKSKLLCNRKLHTCAAEDTLAFVDASQITCPKCLAIVARLER